MSYFSSLFFSSLFFCLEIGNSCCSVPCCCYIPVRDTDYTSSSMLCAWATQEPGISVHYNSRVCCCLVLFCWFAVAQSPGCWQKFVRGIPSASALCRTTPYTHMPHTLHFSIARHIPTAPIIFLSLRFVPCSPALGEREGLDIPLSLLPYAINT